MLDDLFFELVNELDGISQTNSGDEFLANTGRRYGLSHVAYLGLNIPSEEPDKVHIISSYSDKWCRRYVSKNYVDIDPVIQTGLQGILPVDWRTVRDQNKRVRQFFGEAGEFGIGKQGMSIPIRGAQGETALFSVNSHVNDNEWKELKKNHMRDFQVLAYHFHTKVMADEGIDVGTGTTLTPREKECIKWAAAGKTSWETGMILGISKSTVDFFVEGVRSKLQAVNKTQAVAQAIRMKLID